MSDNYTPAAERTIYTGICSNDDCKATIAIWPHWESTDDLPEICEWDGFFFDCLVCGSTLDMDWADPVKGAIRTGYDIEGSI